MEYAGWHQPTSEYFGKMNLIKSVSLNVYRNAGIYHLLVNIVSLGHTFIFLAMGQLMMTLICRFEEAELQ